MSLSFIPIYQFYISRTMLYSVTTDYSQNIGLLQTGGDASPQIVSYWSSTITILESNYHDSPTYTLHASFPRQSDLHEGCYHSYVSLKTQRPDVRFIYTPSYLLLHCGLNVVFHLPVPEISCLFAFCHNTPKQKLFVPIIYSSFLVTMLSAILTITLKKLPSMIINQYLYIILK